MTGAARKLLIVGAVLACAAAVVGAIALASHERGQGVVPDRIQPSAPGSSPALPPAQCPAGVPGCRTVSGRIVYVEAVDPDGDGDAHFVLADSASITGPGVTAVDVRADLRPQPLPGVGDQLSAAGPVSQGSYGQSQLEAVAVQAGG